MDYLQRTTRSERMVRCYAAAKKANRKRLLSGAPNNRLSGADVWNVIEAARGRCAHCGSLAVESRPSSLTGAPIAWAQVGRRIGSLEHVHWRFGGGDNDLSNLAWACLWCNTWPSERRPHALDHGGFYPSERGFLPDVNMAVRTADHGDAGFTVMGWTAPRAASNVPRWSLS
jgi:hypothetical protein